MNFEIVAGSGDSEEWEARSDRVRLHLETRQDRLFMRRVIEVAAETFRDGPERHSSFAENALKVYERQASPESFLFSFYELETLANILDEFRDMQQAGIHPDRALVVANHLRAVAIMNAEKFEVPDELSEDFIRRNS